ncbi:MAG: 50S ribosomal protein L10 [Planctomycetes bacterium]|nr:50S ribosomal protein L10 [Planctomycetota bacterium]
MPNIVNQMVVRELTEEFKDAEGLLAVSFGGLDVKTTEELRGQLAEKGVRFRMVRNSLARRVLAERGIDLGGDIFKGNVGIAYGDPESVIGAAKVFADPAVQKAKKVVFKAAYFDGEVLDAANAAQVADLPDRDTANAMLLGVLSAPARGLVVALAGVQSNTVRVLQARVDKGEE